MSIEQFLQELLNFKGENLAYFLFSISIFYCIENPMYSKLGPNFN